MRTIQTGAAAVVIAAVAIPAAFAANPIATLAGGFNQAAEVKGTLRHNVQYCPRRVVRRRVYVPYWAGGAPSYYYGAYPAYYGAPAPAYPAYQGYANVYMPAPAVPAYAPAPVVAAPTPVVTTAPVFPFSLF
jgi:hypothetical protein